MKIYLVGGAVRDKLLGRPSKDQDFVVVGATEQFMLEQGYSKVGSDFPVFLKDGCEYALARTERKSGHGYNGFTTSFDPSVTLEDDLRRRDLTINAMAIDPDTGAVVDPFGGQNDLLNGVLRHVSLAFAEDPLRVLRVARFAARLNFSIHPDTMDMMRYLVRQGEMKHLTKERVWLELQKAMSEKWPHVFFQVLDQCGALQDLFPELQYAYKKATFPLGFAGQKGESSITNFAIVCNWISDYHDLDRFCRRIQVPNEYSGAALRAWLLATEMRRKPNASSALNTFNAMRSWNNYQAFDDAAVVCWYVAQANEGYRAYIARLQRAFDIAMKISFASLSDQEKTTLIGQEIGKRINEIRADAIAGVLAE